MKKRVIAFLMIFVMLFTLAGCDDEYWEDDWEDEEEVWQGQVDQAAWGNSEKGLSMSVNDDTGELVISRMEASQPAEVGDEGVWTILVYLCGSDLESDGGMGTDDMEEMLSVRQSENVRFVVQTGGAGDWYNSEVESDKSQRFVIRSGEIAKVDEKSKQGMGRAGTLADFLCWSAENYASEHMGLILWNHGGGSISGVCFDEQEDGDSLDLTELDEALFTCLNKTGRRFDLIGFDACLMGTVEMANILATYADYMVGSQETEPGSGWDYTEIGEYLASNPGADGAALGKKICDSFLASCKESGDDDLTTLSVINLSKMDEFLTAFHAFAKDMYEAGQNASDRAEMVRAIESTDNFGGNNRSEGYTNMVDLGGIISACAPYTENSDTVKAALDGAVVYSVSGAAHKGASGLSMYYPLSVQGSHELTVFSRICISPYYLSFIDRQNQTGAGTLSGGQQYDDTQWFGDGGEWCWGDSGTEGYWDYLDDYEQTGESPFITFEQEPFLDDDGIYWFALDENGYYNAANVSAIVYEISADEEDLIELGETIDVYGDWESGIFEDNFDGYWLSLPDGQNLATYIVEMDYDYVIYTSPILLNGEEMYLRMKQYYDDGSVVIEGAWEGINEYGAAARDIIQLKPGDRIVPTYDAFAMEGDDEYVYQGIEYIVSRDMEIYYDLLESGDYLYSFCIDDIYGDYYLSDPVLFSVDENGDTSFYME